MDILFSPLVDTTPKAELYFNRLPSDVIYMITWFLPKIIKTEAFDRRDVEPKENIESVMVADNDITKENDADVIPYFSYPYFYMAIIPQNTGNAQIVLEVWEKDVERTYNSYILSNPLSLTDPLSPPVPFARSKKTFDKLVNRAILRPPGYTWQIKHKKWGVLSTGILFFAYIVKGYLYIHYFTPLLRLIRSKKIVSNSSEIVVMDKGYVIRVNNRSTSVTYDKDVDVSKENAAPARDIVFETYLSFRIYPNDIYRHYGWLSDKRLFWTLVLSPVSDNTYTVRFYNMDTDSYSSVTLPIIPYGIEKMIVDDNMNIIWYGRTYNDDSSGRLCDGKDAMIPVECHYGGVIDGIYRNLDLADPGSRIGCGLPIPNVKDFIVCGDGSVWASVSSKHINGCAGIYRLKFVEL